MKRLIAVSFIASLLVCVATTAGGQVVDNGKVVADPATDYRKYSKEIAASEKADQAKEAQAVSAAQQSVGEDEAAFQASLAAEAQSLNAGAPQTQADASTAPTLSDESQRGLSSGVLIAIVAAILGGLVLVAIVLSALKGKKSRRRREPKEESVRLADFARKPDPEDQ